jgi:hypothetical protein
MINFIKSFLKSSLKILLAFILLGVLIFIGLLVYETGKNLFASFTFTLSPSTGAPQITGKVLHNWHDEGFQDGAMAEIIEIPEENREEVRKILMGETFSISSFDEWNLEQGERPTDHDFSWCEDYASKEEMKWLKQKPGENQRFILWNPQKKKQSEFHFVIIDLKEKQIFVCHGSH